MSKPRVFFSHSFLKRDKKVCDWFKKILNDFFVVDSAVKPEPNYILNKIIPKINNTEYFIAFLCKRACVLDKFNNKTNSYISSPWIYSELGYAVAKKKKILIFAEEGIHDKGMYSMDFNITYINPTELENHHEDVKEYIKKAIEEYKQIKEGKSFVITELSKEITAYKDGHGIVEVMLNGRILNDNIKQLSDQGVWLSNSKGKKIFFTKLSKPEERKKRHYKNTIHFHPLSKNLQNCKVDIIKSLTGRNGLLIIPRSDLGAGSVIKYGFGVSAKDIFNDYKQKLSESASHEVIDGTERLKLKLNLEAGMQIKNEPELKVYDNRKNSMSKFIIPPKKSNSPYYHIFEWELEKSQINIGYEYCIKWKRN